MKVRDPAVSSVISEMLIISIVIILIPMVTITLMYQLPDSREPTVNIKMNVIITNDDLETVELYHKGGDYIKQEDISMIIRYTIEGKNEENRYNYKNLSFNSSILNSQIFDLSDMVYNADKINAKIDHDSNIDVSLVAKNSVVYHDVYHY